MNKRWHAAADWLQRLDRSDVSDEELQAWLDWRGESRENDRAFEEMQDLYQTLRSTSLEQKDALRQLANSPQPRVNTRFRWALAAGIVFVMVAASMGWKFSMQPPVYSTERGQHRNVSLPDGSQLVLGGDSSVAMAYSGSQRILRLHRGEAYFQVKREASRPFSVQAGDVRITALGTSFDVQHDSERVTVAVAEGAVRVSRDSGQPDLRLEAGEKTVIPMHPRAQASAPLVKQVNPTTISSWQEGQLQFSGEPLGVVVESVNRYAHRRIVMVEPEVAAMSYTGTVQRERADEWIDNLPQIFSVKKIDLPDGDVVLLNKDD